jgi:hypothetical protein
MKKQRPLILLPIFASMMILLGCSGNDQKKTEQPKFTNTNWKGTWERNSWQSEASLEIISINGDSLEFKLLAFSGGHDGEVEGKAFIGGNRAIYYSADENDTCSLVFKIFGDTLISVDQEKGICFAPMGVSYEGNYYSSKYQLAKEDKKVAKRETLLTLGVFDNDAEDSIFRKLMGDDYDLFLGSTQLSSESDDLDSLNAKVRSSGVRGLFTSMENIIMIDTANNIWAAVIDDDKVLYYTNRIDYRSKLPKTIEEWRSRFKEYPVIYKSEK